MERLKKISVAISLLFLLIGCNKSKNENNDSQNKNNNPIGIAMNDNENPKLTLLNYIKMNDYNPKGYYFTSQVTDKYGYSKTIKYSKTMIFSKDVVNELKKYITVEDFWNSDYGSSIVNKIIDCLGNGNTNQVVMIDNKNLKELKTIEDVKNCLVGFEWSYPNKEEPFDVWKFSSDGTFIFTSTMSGGYKTWGKWEAFSPEKIKISYEGIKGPEMTEIDTLNLRNGETLTMMSCGKFNIGSTSYTKD